MNKWQASSKILERNGCQKTWQKVIHRRKLNVLNGTTRQQKKLTNDQYTTKDKEVKKSYNLDKGYYVERLAQELQKTLAVHATSKRCTDNNTTNAPTRDTDGNILTKIYDQFERWRDNLQQLLNRPWEQYKQRGWNRSICLLKVD